MLGFALFNFITIIILISLVNMLAHLIVNRINFNKYGTDRIDNYSTGLIIDFKTGKSKTQYGPRKSS